MHPRDRHNAALNISGETLWGLKAHLVAPAAVLTVLLARYGATGPEIGAIAAIETGGILLPQVLGVYVFRSRRHLKVWLVLWHVLAILPFMLLMGVLSWWADQMTPALFRAALLACFAGYCFFMGIVVAAWTDYIAAIFKVGLRGTVMGASMFGAALAGTSGALIAGQVIERVPAPLSFALLFFSAWTIGLVSISLWLFFDDPEALTAPDPTRPSLAVLLARFAQSLAEPNFRFFLVARVLAACGFCIIPFIAVHYGSPAGGALKPEFVVTCYAALTMGNSLGSLALGWFGDRHGHRAGVLIGTGAQVASLAVLLLVPGTLGCLLAYAGAGLCTACGFVSHYNIVLESCPHEHRMLHISVANLVIGLPLGVAPLLAGAAAQAWGLKPLFALCLLFSLVAFVVVLCRVKDPRTLPVRG